MVIHKLFDTVEKRVIQIEQILAERPLENKLGFMNFGKYKQENYNAYQYFNNQNVIGNQYRYISGGKHSGYLDLKNDANG